MAVNLLLIAGESERQAIYLKLLKNLDVSITAIPSFSDVDATLAERFFNGLLVDFNTRFKAIKENRNFVYRIMEKLPVAILRLDEEKQKIKAFYRGFSQKISIEEFIDKKCRPFKLRRFRYHVRKPIHFNIYLSQEASVRNRAGNERSFTLDVSRGGCFAFSAQDWVRDDPVWIAARELKDKTPIRGVVRHVTAWGTELKAPGIGIEIMDIQEGQKKQLVREFGL